MLIRYLLAFLLSFILIASFFAIPVSAFNFESHSGIKNTGSAAGYDAANLTDVSFSQTVGKIIRILLSLIGVFFFLLFLYAGFIWMLSRGNTQDIEKAKKIMQNALIGLIVVLMAYAITVFVTQAITRAV